MKRKIITLVLAGAVLFIANICMASAIIDNYGTSSEEICSVLDNLETST